MKKNKVVYLRDMKRKNQANILSIIFRKKEISRTELSVFTGLNPATVSVLTKELLDNKMIVEGQEGKPTSPVGGNRILLQINPNGGCICAVSVLTEAIIYTLFNTQLEKIDEFSVENSPEIMLHQLFENLVRNIDRLLANSPEAGERLLGIGISIPRAYYYADRKVLFSTGVSLDRTELDIALRFKYKKPVFIEHEFYSHALAEYYLGSAKDMEAFIFIDVSEDIQAVVVQKGQIVKLPLLVKNNLRHVIIDRNGPKCGSCGKRGCLETFSTTGGIVNSFKTGLREGKTALVDKLPGGDINKVDFNMINQCAEGGDSFIEGIIMQTAEVLCIGIFNIMALLKIHNAVVDGKVGRMNHFARALTEAWANRAIFKRERSCIMVSSVRQDEVNAGNGAIVLGNHFKTYFVEDKLVNIKYKYI